MKLSKFPFTETSTETPIFTPLASNEISSFLNITIIHNLKQITLKHKKKEYYRLSVSIPPFLNFLLRVTINGTFVNVDSNTC